MITLKKIVDLLIEENLLRELVLNNEWHYIVTDQFADVKFNSLSYNSQEIEPESLFICKGFNFKEEYLKSALDNGAIGYMAEYLYDNYTNLAIIVKNVQKAMAVVARAFYDYPDKSLKTIGITGTKGKTTTAYMVRHVLKENGSRVAQLSSERNILDGKTEEVSTLTTPESLDLFRMMKKAVDFGMEYLVMEVSSQAYKLNRVYGITYDFGIFLNISPDHISDIEHPTFDDYFSCKIELFSNCKQAIVNADTDYYHLILDKINNKNLPCITYGMNRLDSDYNYVMDGMKLDLHNNNDNVVKICDTFSLSMPGDFNKPNAVAAIIIGLLNQVEISDIKAGLKNTVVPGRMEYIHGLNNVDVYVDYAHNYLSMKEAMKFLHQAYPNGRVIAVTGSIGGKAKNRRHDLGKAMSEEANIAIVTSEDSQYENPQSIMDEIAQSIVNPQVEVHVIEDRKLAIKKACQIASSGDVIFIAGKGCETFLKVQGKTIDYPGDLQVALEYINSK